MIIEPIHTIDRKYLQFVESHASVYNQPDWLALYGSNNQVMGVFENDTLLAVFNFYTFKKSVLRFSIPPPFCPDCALLIADNMDATIIRERIVNWLEQQLRKTTYSLTRFNLSYKHFKLFEETTIAGFKKVHHHTYVLDLKEVVDVQTLYAPKRRQQIRRAIKDGLNVHKVADMDIVFSLVKKTFDRQKKSIDERFVKKILFDFANEANSFAFASYRGAEPLVVYFCIYHKKEAYYLMGGFDSNQKHIGAGPLAMNACIEHSKALGIEIFDFEGSMEPSIEKYFKEFGGTKKLYPCFEKTNKMGELAVKIKKIIRK